MKIHDVFLLGAHVYIEKKSRSLYINGGQQINPHRSLHTDTHTHTQRDSLLSQHLVKSETAHAQTNLKQSEGLAGADGSSRYSARSDSLPCSPHLSALYKEQPLWAGSPLLTPLLWHRAPRPSSDNSGMVCDTFIPPLHLVTRITRNF